MRIGSLPHDALRRCLIDWPELKRTLIIATTTVSVEKLTL